MAMGMGHLLSVWQCLCPETRMPTLDAETKMLMAGMGMISIKGGLIMQVVLKTSERIIALHDSMVFLFSVEALEGNGSLAKDQNNPENLGRRVVGIYFDKDFKRREVLNRSDYHGMIVDADKKPHICMTQEKHAELLDRDAKLSALEAGGVDNWEWYGESLKDYWAEKEEKDGMSS